MKTSLRILTALFAVLLPASAFAQQAETRPFLLNQDLAVTAPNYGHLLPVQGPTQGYGTVSTSGSSTTLTADATAQTPFSLVTVGSLIRLQTGVNTFVSRTVTAKGSATSITLSSAVNVVAVNWFYSYYVSGTGATDGWLPALTSDYAAVTIYATTIAGTGGLDVQIQCQPGDLATTAVTVYSGNIPTAGNVIIPVAEKCANIRVGLNLHTAATGTDDISAFLTTWRAAH